MVCCVRRSPATGGHFRKVVRGVGVFVDLPLRPFMVQAKPAIIELDMDKLEQILRRLDAKELDAEDYETIKAVIGAYVYLFNAVGDKDTTIRRLRQMLFGAKTEKTSAVIGGLKDEESAFVPAEAKDVPESPAAGEDSVPTGFPFPFWFLSNGRSLITRNVSTTPDQTRLLPAIP